MQADTGSSTHPSQVIHGRQLLLLSLADVAQRLARADQLGQRAPALITLKRWSAAKALDRAQHRPAGRKRPLYDYETVKALCLSRKAGTHEILPSQPHAEQHVAAEPSDEPAPASHCDAQPTGHGDAQAAHHGRLTHPREGASTISTEQYAALGQRLDRLEMQFRVIEQSLDKLLAGQAPLLSQLTQLAAAANSLEHSRKALMLRYDGENTELRARLQAVHGPGAMGDTSLELTLARLERVAWRLEGGGPRSDKDTG